MTLASSRSLDRAELTQIPNQAEQAAQLDDLLELRRLQKRAAEIAKRNPGDRELARLAVRAINGCLRRGVGVMGRTGRAALVGGL